MTTDTDRQSRARRQMFRAMEVRDCPAGPWNLYGNPHSWDWHTLAAIGGVVCRACNKELIPIVSDDDTD